MVAAECVPFAKAGGLGDVIGALPSKLAELGLQVSIIIPRYKGIDLEKHGFQPYPVPGEARIPFGWEEVQYDAHAALLDGSSVRVFLIGNDRFFDRDGIYVDPFTGRDYPDQADRWIFFNRAAIDFIQRVLPDTDVIHCHDHQTALIPAYLRKFYRRDGAFAKTHSVYTIHNLGYQGMFPREVLWRAGFDDSEFYPASPFEFYGVFNFMKVGIVHADAITTVSPTYAREIQESKEYGYSLDGVLRERSRDLFGILNGVDVDVWNPGEDKLIPARYDASHLEAKALNKRELLKEFGLGHANQDWPLLCMISRIDVQKGFDLLVTILDDVLAGPVNFVLLGTGNKETEAHLRAIADRHPDQAGLRFAFDNRLAHLTEAGADIFLMPSRYEPCGLNQMYSMRYGTVPVVRSTGGLADTVQEFSPSTREGTGFVFGDYEPIAFRAAIERALAAWNDRPLWECVIRNGMNQDFSWNVSARKYLEVYSRVMR